MELVSILLQNEKGRRIVEEQHSTSNITYVQTNIHYNQLI